jgi:hypothetical protein
VPTLEIKATGRGTYWRTKLTAHGFPRGYCMRTKSVRGFRTGDMVRAEVQRGARKGVHVRRVGVARNGQFTVGGVKDVGWQWCRLLQRGDGHGYAVSEAASAGCAVTSEPHRI